VHRHACAGARCYARAARRRSQPHASQETRFCTTIVVNAQGVNSCTVNAPGVNEEQDAEQESARRNPVTGSRSPAATPEAVKTCPLSRLLGVKGHGVKPLLRAAGIEQHRRAEPTRGDAPKRARVRVGALMQAINIATRHQTRPRLCDGSRFMLGLVSWLEHARRVTVTTYTPLPHHTPSLPQHARPPLPCGHGLSLARGGRPFS
jgi:hypothetical protein